MKIYKISVIFCTHQTPKIILRRNKRTLNHNVLALFKSRGYGCIASKPKACSRRITSLKLERFYIRVNCQIKTYIHIRNAKVSSIVLLGSFYVDMTP
jgi:hypothetical protein